MVFFVNSELNEIGHGLGHGLVHDLPPLYEHLPMPCVANNELLQINRKLDTISIRLTI